MSTPFWRRRFACILFWSSATVLMTTPAGLADAAQAEVRPARPAALFTDNMVLQRDLSIPVWGMAQPNARVEVRLAGHRASTVADDKGDWELALPPLPAGGPYQLEVISDAVLVLDNVMIGDVWVCSGQSNMAWPVNAGAGQVRNAAYEQAHADWPGIRLFTVFPRTSDVPQETVAGSGWRMCSPETIGPFSAVGYFFGRALHQHLNVPIGLINSSFGGTTAEAWTSDEGLHTLPHLAAFQDEVGRHPELLAAARAQFDRDFSAWKEQLDAADAGFQDGQPVWAMPDHPSDSWGTITVPGHWEKAGYPDLDGVMWYRREVDIPPSWANKALILHLDAVNDRLEAWFNGVQVAGWSGTAETLHGFSIPPESVSAGRNVLVVRVFDMGNLGGLCGEPSRMYLIRADAPEIGRVSLVGEWRCMPGCETHGFPPFPRPPLLHPDNQNRPAGLFNAMIAPLTRFPIKGVIWYQGEGNAARAYEYRDLFPALIRDWRMHWRLGDFPFLFVQLANFLEVQDAPGDDAWAELREAQAMALSLPKTGMAVAIDLGDAEDVHPRNKQDVGMRLALAARYVAYGEELVYSGPVFKEAVREDHRMRIRFSSVGGGLVAKGSEELRGFAVAGEDRRFVWAHAAIEDDSVVVWHEDVRDPVAVRYGWASNPVCNLYNQEGLPAAPFRTDDWPGITQGRRLELPPVPDAPR